MRIRHHENSEFLNLFEPAELPVARATKMLLFIIPSSLTRSTVGLTRSNCRCAHLAVLMHTRRLRDESLMTGAALCSSFWQALFKSPPADEGNAGDTATGRNSAPHQQVHTASGAAEDSVHREALKAKGRVVQLMLAEGEPGGNVWMRWVSWRAVTSTPRVR